MTRRKPVLRERALHLQVAAYLRVVLPVDCAWTTFPAGGGGAARGGQLKAVALRPGWPDLQVLYKSKFLGIELKAKDGRLSEDQQVCKWLIIEAGGTWALCRSIDDVELTLAAFGIPLRGKVQS